MLRNAGINLLTAMIVAFGTCVTAFGEGSLEGYELPSDVDTATGWECYVLAIVSIGLISVCAFKKSKRTHLD